MMVVDRRIYLDYNATSPLLVEARQALVEALDLPGNPSSVHSEGREARAVIEKARRNVARLVAGDPEAVVFTGSATEAAATCLCTEWLRDGEPVSIAELAVVDTDHAALREGGRFTPERITRLAVDANGLLRLESLDAWLADLGDRTGMLAMCLVNGETGVVQALDPVRERIAGRSVLLVLDVVQAAGRMPLNVAQLGADAVVVSGHKIGAAKGVGAFVLHRRGTRPFRLVAGGGQEKGLRSGTEALPAIASFGAAARVAAEQASVPMDGGVVGLIEERLRSAGCRLTVLGGTARRVGNTLAIALHDLKAETAQIALDLEGFAVSAGSACSSGKVGRSHVLDAMAAAGLDVDPGLGLLRVSVGRETAAADVEAFAQALIEVVARARERADGRRAA
jgi:cysteine desulfurase